MRFLYSLLAIWFEQKKGVQSPSRGPREGPPAPSGPGGVAHPIGAWEGREPEPLGPEGGERLQTVAGAGAIDVGRKLNKYIYIIIYIYMCYVYIYT